MRTALNVLDTLFSWIESIMIIVLMLVATALGLTQIVLRYIFNTGISGLETYFVIVTAAAMLLSGTRAVRDDKHVRVELLALVSSPRVNALLQITSNLLGFMLCAFLFYACYSYTVFTQMMETVSLETGLPDWQISLIATFCLGMFALRYFIRFIRSLSGEDVPLHGAAAVAEQSERRV
jgi:C4-dicarboxylate transporter, DctQ subunit